MAAQTWDSLQTTLLIGLSQSQAPYNVIPSNFSELMPQATSYAENRIYRRLVMLNARTSASSLITLPGQRTLQLSAMTTQVVVPEGFALYTPANATTVQVPFDFASLDAIDLCWPQQNLTMNPANADPSTRLWAMLDDQTLIMCPTPDATYLSIITGLFQPDPISPTNQSTYLSEQYPELLQAGCMVFLTGWLTRNYGAQADEPRMALSFESQFQSLLDLADDEERRRRGLAPNIAKTPPRPPQQDASPVSAAQ